MKRLRVHYRGWGEDWPLGHLADDGRVLLMDRLFRRRGLRHPGPLDRLAFIGERAMGALRFVPAQEEDAETPDWDLATLADESARALDGEAGVALRELAVVGGSPHGARLRPGSSGEPVVRSLPRPGRLRCRAVRP